MFLKTGLEMLETALGQAILVWLPSVLRRQRVCSFIWVCESPMTFSAFDNNGKTSIERLGRLLVARTALSGHCVLGTLCPTDGGAFQKGSCGSWVGPAVDTVKWVNK